MDVLMLATPIVVAVGLLALLQRIEAGMTEKAPVRIPTGDLGAPRAAEPSELPPSDVATRADVVGTRRPVHSPLIAGAPLAVVVTLAVITAGAVVRMAA